MWVYGSMSNSWEPRRSLRRAECFAVIQVVDVVGDGVVVVAIIEVDHTA